MTIPVLVPLGNGSLHGDNELRYMLRSLEKNAKDLGTVYLMTTCAPAWIKESDRLVIVPIADEFFGGKDGSLHNKTLETIKRHDIDKFCWTADDCAFLQPMNLADIPVIHNHREKSVFYQEVGNHWRQRVRATFEWAKEQGADLKYQFECHCPQCFYGKRLLEGMKGVPWNQGVGLTIFTAWRVVTGTWQESISQTDVKWTFEGGLDIDSLTDEQILSKPFLGYNNVSAEAVLGRLAKMFPLKSKYEK